jgi:hypothetical protein
MQIAKSGGRSQTAQIAEQVSPARPAGPSVVTTATAVPNFDSASLNSFGDTPPACCDAATVAGPWGIDMSQA